MGGASPAPPTFGSSSMEGQYLPLPAGASSTAQWARRNGRFKRLRGIMYNLCGRHGQTLGFWVCVCATLDACDSSSVERVGKAFPSVCVEVSQWGA